MSRLRSYDQWHDSGPGRQRRRQLLSNAVLPDYVRVVRCATCGRHSPVPRLLKARSKNARFRCSACGGAGVIVSVPA